MRKLIYVPIIHMAADLGSLAHEITERGVGAFGIETWQRHLKIVEGLWKSIGNWFASVEARNLKIYQDGMVADGEMGRVIVEEGVKAGSLNYKVIDGLIKRGATLVKTEDIDFLKQERARFIEMAGAKNVFKRFLSYLKYLVIKTSLLRKRDRFIATRINETLDENEVGVLFIGAYHEVIPYLQKDIEVVEIKNRKTLRFYRSKFAVLDGKTLEDISKEITAPVLQ